MEADPAKSAVRVSSRYWMVLAQIAIIDMQMLNIRARRRRAQTEGRALPEPVHLHTAPHAASGDDPRPPGGG
jgi:hypothetical protein